MEMHAVNSSIGSRFGQIAWVVPDIHAAEKFFREVVGVPEFVKMENLRADELEGIAYGEQANFVFHLYMANRGGKRIHVIHQVHGKAYIRITLTSIRKEEYSILHVRYPKQNLMNVFPA